MNWHFNYSTFGLAFHVHICDQGSSQPPPLLDEERGGIGPLLSFEKKNPVTQRQKEIQRFIWPNIYIYKK